jgi:hypothetical protein
VTANIAYPFHPKRLKDQHPPLIADLIHLETTGHHDCVSQIIAMIADLKEQGTNSRFLKAFSGGILELKSRARGGDKGGARVYLFRTSQNEFLLCHAECKQGNFANATLLADTAEIFIGFETLGLKIFPHRRST